MGCDRLAECECVCGIQGRPDRADEIPCRELGPEHITVNAIAPGIIDTPQLQVDADDAGIPLSEMHEEYASAIPLGRIGKPADIAAAVSLLARNDIGALIGQTIQINGGTTRCRT